MISGFRGKIQPLLKELCLEPGGALDPDLSPNLSQLVCLAISPWPAVLVILFCYDKTL